MLYLLCRYFSGSDWVLLNLNSQRIGPYSGNAGYCLNYKYCRDVSGTRHNMVGNHYHWTTDSCEIKIKVDKDGMVAIIHQPANTQDWKQWGKTYPPFVQSHVGKCISTRPPTMLLHQ